MSYFGKFERTFGDGASPFVKWTLTPVLVLFTLLIVSELPRPYQEGRPEGVAMCIVLAVMAIAGVLALWGVRHAGRMVTAIIGGFTIFYLIDQWILHYPGNARIAGGRSSESPLNAIFAFLAFGLPSLIYTFFGRFTIRPTAPHPQVETLFLIFTLDDKKFGSSKLRSRLRDLADAISDNLCDGINSDYDGEDDNENGKASIGFWATDVEEFARRIREEFPEESLLANCTWIRRDVSGAEKAMPNPYGVAD